MRTKLPNKNRRGDSSSGDSRTPVLLIDSPAYYLQSAYKPGSKHQASTRPLEARTSTQTRNGYSSLNSTSPASEVFPVLSHNPKGNLATQFSFKTVAHPYHHHDIDFNRQPSRGQTPSEKPNAEPRITSAHVQCWDHGCNGKRFSTLSNLFRHQREKKRFRRQCSVHFLWYKVYSHDSAQRSYKKEGLLTVFRRVKSGVEKQV